MGNKGYRRYLRSEGEVFGIDEAKVEEEARYDGKWVLRTNTELKTSEVALKYKQLWMVEAIFRSSKSLLETRPIYHKCDETIRGHVFCSFLALVLRKELQDRLEAKGYKLEWADVLQGLGSAQGDRGDPGGEALPAAHPGQGSLREGVPGGRGGSAPHCATDRGGQWSIG